MMRPLADELRPSTLDEVVGQKHILGKTGLLRRVIEGGNVPNLVFFGPSGTGKTLRLFTSSLFNSKYAAAYIIASFNACPLIVFIVAPF